VPGVDAGRSKPRPYNGHALVRGCLLTFPVMPVMGRPRIEAVLFDWDGTLLDSFDADSRAYLAMFREMGIPWGLEELATHYSPNWYNVYRAARLPRGHWDAANLAWRRQYACHRPKLVRGARRLLAWVGRRYRIGLVTSGDRGRVMRQLRYFGLTRLFAARVCADDTVRKKPHPAPVTLQLMEQLQKSWLGGGGKFPVCVAAAKENISIIPARECQSAKTQPNLARSHNGMNGDGLRESINNGIDAHSGLIEQ
jgi:hypothetical protein